MDTSDMAGTSGSDNPRDDIPCQLVGSLDGALHVTTDPSKLTAVQLQIVAGEAAHGVLALSIEGALDLTFRLIAAANELRRQARRNP